MDAERPKLREDLDFFPVQSAGGTVIMIHDRLGLVEKGKSISPELYKVMTMLDGTQSVRDIQLDMIRQQGGMLISIEEVEALLAKLDSSYLLNSPRYREARKEIISNFSAQKIRYCSHAGLSYPKQEEKLRGVLDTILAAQQVQSFPDGKITAVIAPHIDLEAGKRVYSSAYQAIKGVSPKRVIILGVGHSVAKEMFSLTKKAFETPLGRVETDQGIVTELVKAGDNIVSRDDFAHRDEHSIEFQLIFLQQILRDIAFTIVPVLCGSLIRYLPDYSREGYISLGGDFLTILADAARGEGTILIAGVDLSHVGPKFGHDMAASLIINQSERHDRQLLNFLCARNADGFWSESRRIGDEYNVCGFAALACLLETLPPSQGHLLGYEIFREDSTRSAVSFAAAIFTNRAGSRM
ncbi:MAG: AmmeMemoRadiSam system protein B [Deltaproteobacteria bacterium]|nr:MAG: AmmeMemoRadiSam system protein B [Deltaproteobacteria bacterium]